MVVKDRVQDRIARVAGVMRSPATGEAATSAPEVAAPVKRLCRKCGRYFDSEACVACKLAKFLADEPKVHESGWPCAICGTSEADEWFTQTDGFRVRMRMVSRPTCRTCHVMRAQDKTPMGDTEEMWLDFRIAQELGVAGPWLERGAEPWVNKAHGLSRLFVKVGEEQRPMIACELTGYVNSLDNPGAKSRRPLWWLKLNKVMAEAYFADFGKLKVHHLARDQGSVYYLPTEDGGTGSGNEPFTGTKSTTDIPPYPHLT